MDEAVDECVDSYFYEAANGESFADEWEFASEHFSDGADANKMDGDDLIDTAQEAVDEGQRLRVDTNIRQALESLACEAMTSRAATAISDEMQSEGLDSGSEITAAPDGEQVKEVEEGVYAMREDDEYRFWKHVEVRGSKFWVNVDHEHDADSLMVMEESLEDDE